MHARRVREPGPDARVIRPTRSLSSSTNGSARRPARRSGGQATRKAPFFAPDDLRRIAAALASGIVPGLGQLLNGRIRLAKWMGIPVLALAVMVALLVVVNSPARLFASMVSPTAMGILLALNLLLVGWRLVAVIHAFFDGRYEARSGRGGAVALALILVVVIAPHGIANAWGNSAQAAFSNVFAARTGSGPGPQVASTSTHLSPTDRVNILVVGVDAFPTRTEMLTDSLMVVSVDPVGKTVSIVSLPRDIVRVPLGNGNVFGPKINSLMSYANRHKDQFPQGGMRTLEDAVGALLGVPIHYYARMDFLGFVKLIDAVGGVDLDVKKAFYDPVYDGLGVNPGGAQGWGITVGPHHLNGWESLAYARSRYAPGESDFTRAARQQEILLALKTRLTTDGGLLTKVPSMLAAFGDLLTTDIPTDRLPDLAVLADELKPGAVYRMVLIHPLVGPGNDPKLGSIQIPDIAAIQKAVKAIFPAPGGTPIVWPATSAGTPVASAAP